MTELISKFSFSSVVSLIFLHFLQALMGFFLLQIELDILKLFLTCVDMFFSRTYLWSESTGLRTIVNFCPSPQLCELRISASLIFSDYLLVKTLLTLLYWYIFITEKRENWAKTEQRQNMPATIKQCIETIIYEEKWQINNSFIVRKAYFLTELQWYKSCVLSRISKVIRVQKQPNRVLESNASLAKIASLMFVQDYWKNRQQ